MSLLKRKKTLWSSQHTIYWNIYTTPDNTGIIRIQSQDDLEVLNHVVACSHVFINIPDESIIIDRHIFAPIICFGNTTVFDHGNNSIHAFDKTIVVGNDGSHIRAYENTAIDAYEHCLVWASGYSNVTVHNSSKVFGCSEFTTIFAYDNSTVKSYGSTVHAYDNADVEAMRESTVYLYNHASLFTQASSSTVYITDECSGIVESPLANIIIDDAANVALDFVGCGMRFGPKANKGAIDRTHRYFDNVNTTHMYGSEDCENWQYIECDILDVGFETIVALQSVEMHPTMLTMHRHYYEYDDGDFLTNLHDGNVVEKITSEQTVENAKWLEYLAPGLVMMRDSYIVNYEGEPV